MFSLSTRFFQSTLIFKRIALLICIFAFTPAVIAKQAISNVDNLYEQALISFQNEKFSTSLIHLKNALQRNSEHMPSRVLLAQVLIEQGNGVAAEIELKRAQKAQVDNDRLVTLFGHAYLLQHRYDDALAVAAAGERNIAIETDLLLISGQAYIGKKQYSSADKAFTKVLKLAPNEQLALLGRAQIALKKGQIDNALAFIERAVTSAKPFVNGWVFKGQLYAKLGNYPEAMLAIEQALLIEPSHLSARLIKAMLHIQLSQYNEALVHVNYILAQIPAEPRAGYLKAIINASIEDKQSGDKKLTEVIATLGAVPPEVMRSTPDYYYLAGLTNYQFGNLNDARRYLMQYLNYTKFDIATVSMIATIDLKNNDANLARSLLGKTNLAKPNNINILSLLGLSYLQLGDNEKAQFYFEKVLNIQPNSPIGISNLARTYMKSGDYKTAIKALSAIKENKINSVQIKLMLVDSYQNTQNYVTAIQLLEQLVEEFPQESFFQQRLGTIYGLSGDIDKAKQAFNVALTLDSTNVLAIIHLARIDNISGNVEQALAFLEKQLALFEQNVLIIGEISDTYLLMKDLKNASLWINKAYALAPNNLDVLVRLTNVLAKEKQLDKAVATVKLFMSHNSKQPDALLLLASLYQQQNKHQQAVSVLRDHLSKSKNRGKTLILLAKAQIKAGNKKAAVSSYKKAIVINEKSLQAHLGLVNLVIANKDEKFALTLINSISQLSSSPSLAATLKGDLYYRLGDLVKAEGYYLQALKLSDQKQAILGLYKNYKKQQQAHKAIKPLTTWLSKYPNDMMVAISLADSYKSNEQLQKAADSYEALIAQYGQLPLLLNNIASVHFALGNQQKAKQYAQQAYNYLPDNIAIIDTFAWIQSQLGEYEQALALFRKALVKDFNNAEIKYHLAVTLNGLNRHIEAKKYLIEAVESSDDFAEKKQAKALLKSW